MYPATWAAATHTRMMSSAAELRPTGLDSTTPPMVEETVQRVVEEALTNAAKHAPGAEVRVRLERWTDRMSVTVTNEAPDCPPPGSAAAPARAWSALPNVSGSSGAH